MFIPELYPEIESKKSSPYFVMLFTIKDNRFALPFRTNIRHDYCFRFHTSSRPTESITGIDFTKAVIVNNDEYIGDAARIDDKEYNELYYNHQTVIREFKAYLDGYIRYALKTFASEHKPKSPKALKYRGASKYLYTSLKYFHRELGIE